jgi:prepilin-type N-terminal cleavage/methylation domain-containing protein
MGTRRLELEREDGFTLLELMVTVTVIGILLTISIPVILGARVRAYDSAAKQTAANAVQTSRSVFAGSATYSTTDATTLGTFEPSLSFVDGATPSNTSRTVSADVPDRAGAAVTLVLAVHSTSGDCFFLRDVATSGITFGKLVGQPDADCKASNAGAVPFGPSW